MRIVIFDLETRLHAEQLDKNKEIGWARLRAGDGGISALAVYDLQDQWLYLYDEHSIREVASHLERADVVVGYRSEGFDFPVVEGLLGRKMRVREHIDLYTLIARTNASRGIVGTKGDFTLDAVCRRAFGRGKSGTGAHAPDLYEQHRYGELFNYCGLDVRLTRDLLQYIATHGGVPNVTGSFLELPISPRVKSAFICN